MNWKSTQNPDGGWAYAAGSAGLRCSWTEPTALVLLAQSVTGVDSESFANGMKFLRSMEGLDGGFRPQPEVRESTWVTAVAALLPEEAWSVAGAVTRTHARSIAWLKGQTGRESGWRYKLEQRLHGNDAGYPKGWPWFPGAAAWVIPTSLGILAFERESLAGSDRELTERVEAGRQYLLSRMCADGGWNHGSNQALGRDGDSYPETTGIGLLALAGVRSAAIERAKAAARKHMATCRTAEGIAWLRMGIAAHGEIAQPGFAPLCRTTMDEALTALADAERNPLTTKGMTTKGRRPEGARKV